jgi:hypothetical protein
MILQSTDEHETRLTNFINKYTYKIIMPIVRVKLSLSRNQIVSFMW